MKKYEKKIRILIAVVTLCFSFFYLIRYRVKQSRIK